MQQPVTTSIKYHPIWYFLNGPGHLCRLPISIVKLYFRETLLFDFQLIFPVTIAQWEFARPVLKNLKLKLEVRWVLQNWGKTEAFRCFLRKWKSVKNWLRYKQFSDFPNSKIFAGMLKKTGRATFPLCNALYT